MLKGTFILMGNKGYKHLKNLYYEKIVFSRLECCGRAVGLMVDDKQAYLVARFESQICSTALYRSADVDRYFCCGACLAAALGNIDLTSHRAGRLFLAAPMDLSHLIVGDRDRLLTFQDCFRALLRRVLSTSFVTRNFKLQYHIIARTPQPGKNQSLRAEQI